MTRHLILTLGMTLAAGSILADPPGVSYTAQLRQQLDAGLQSQGGDYQPRTRHIDPDGRPLYTNRLILQDSPYLLQHAHNPVDWYPWGPEAFARAERENKPIFLSIGYSTCHWCHVMEHESFEDAAVAEYLNTHFVAIKVDRERRPDIDAIYMTAVQLLVGRGGWPMSSFLTTDGKTFFAGTYFPRDRFMGLLQQVVKGWNEDQPGILTQADTIADRVQRYLDRARISGDLARAAPGLAVTQLRERHDDKKGGFSQAPKFPNEPDYFFLIDYARRNSNEELIRLIRFDLNNMAQGGIYDQVGGGFHRYSTDQNWLVPHFEKMLYNQAQLSRVYLQAAMLTGEEEFTRVARQTLDYVLRDMESPGGGFYSATDADSEGHEGIFFLWTPDQVRSVLSKPDAELAIELFNISETGNFEGSNILSLSGRLTDQTPPGRSRDEFLDHIDLIRSGLYSAREQRVHPGRDEKIVTAWNAMMIMSLAEAATLPGGDIYAGAALMCGEYLWNTNRDKNGQLWRTSLNGRSSVPAVQEDYAWLADAFISLYDLGHDGIWLQRARSLLARMRALFWDEAHGGYYMNTLDSDVATAMGRPKDINDGAVPAGNAVALHALARLARRPGERGAFLEVDEHANALLSAFAPIVNRSPSAFPYFLLAAGVLADGQSGSLQYAAHGGVTVSGQVQNRQLTVNISIRPGWHINAHQPLSDDLIPTVLQADEQNTALDLSAVSYPPAKRKKLGFQDEDLALYEGEIKLLSTLSLGTLAQPDSLLRLTLRLQACDEEVCLPPERLHLQIPVRRSWFQNP
jgi:uncharacterized protein YyaL (SSP411 family)